MATSFGFTAAQRLVSPEHLAELAKRTGSNSLFGIADRSPSFEHGIAREFLPSGLVTGRTLLGWRLQEFRVCWRPCLERIGPAKELVDTTSADSLARGLSRLFGFFPCLLRCPAFRCRSVKGMCESAIC